MSPSFIRLRALLALALTAIVTTAVLFAEPAWWVTRGVRDPAKPASDYAALNQGQLKNLVRAARDEMDAKLPGGAGPTIVSLLAGWDEAAGTSNDFQAVNVGQLKAAAKPFYDRLKEVNLASDYPWSASSADDNDFGMANVGQAKSVFSFEIPWGAGIDPALDSDLDGVPDLVELTSGMNRYLQDTDGDGVLDGREIAEGSDPKSAASNSDLMIGLGIWSPLRDLRPVHPASI